VWALWAAFFLSTAAVISFGMLSRGPNRSMPFWLMYFLGLALIFYRPRFGLYIILGLGLAGDGTLSAWFPFMKNFSSAESILFVHDALIINPLETYLAATIVSWVIHRTSFQRLKFTPNPLIVPALIFMGFVFFGLWYGLKNGGVMNIALWEARPFFYLVIMLFLASNLLEERSHVILFLWAAMAGIFFEMLTGLWYFFVLLRGNLVGVNSISDHPAAIHLNTLFVFTISAWYTKISTAKRATLTLMAVAALIPYFANQRRAAFITLGIALVVFSFLLFVENRKRFWQIVPPVLILVLGYVLVFSNIPGPLAGPAKAVISVVSPERASSRDQSSNAYRDLENYNLHFTVRQKPLTGIGFGQKFYVIAPMPDIGWFVWWQYFPHNSIIWIWLKTGAVGFFCLLYLFGYSIMLGAQIVRQLPNNEFRAAALTAILYLIMHITFAYVDIGWDGQSAIYIGAAMGLIGSIERLARNKEPETPKRWRWLPTPSSL
jgi:hypothetical protein